MFKKIFVAVNILWFQLFMSNFFISNNDLHDT